MVARNSAGAASFEGDSWADLGAGAIPAMQDIAADPATGDLYGVASGGIYVRDEGTWGEEIEPTITTFPTKAMYRDPNTGQVRRAGSYGFNWVWVDNVWAKPYGVIDHGFGPSYLNWASTHGDGAVGGSWDPDITYYYSDEDGWRGFAKAPIPKARNFVSPAYDWDRDVVTLFSGTFENLGQSGLGLRWF